MRMCAMISALALTSGVALGGVYNAGDYVYTDGQGDRIVGYSFDSGSASTLLTLSDSGFDYRLAGITRVGGSFYVNSGFAFPDTEGPGRLLRVDNLFSGAGTVSDLSSGEPLQSGIGLRYHAGSDQFLVVNNTAQTQNQTAPNHDGIVGVSSGGVATQRFLEDVNSTDFPRYGGGVYITEDTIDSDRFYVTTVNGGAFRDSSTPNGNFGISSQIYSATVAGDGSISVAQVVDFDGSVGAFGELTFVRGITSVANNSGGTDLYVTDGFTNAIYRVGVDSNGDYVSMDQIVDGLDNPTAIEYNPFRDSLIFHEIGAETISEINLDGTGLTLLESGVVSARGIYIIPAPGAAALFGLAGLAATRRRR